MIASGEPLAGIPTRPMNRLWTLSLLFQLSQLVISTTGEQQPLTQDGGVGRLCACDLSDVSPLPRNTRDHPHARTLRS